VRRLHELGWTENRNIAFEYRWAEGRIERYDEIAAEFVRLNVDVIVTTAPALPAIQKATSVIPIVFALSGDPVATGLVASLARPGGNATGLSMLAPDTAGKRIELLREIVLGVRRLAIMVNLGFVDTVQEGGEAEAAARALGIDVVKLEIRRASDIAPSFDSLKSDALYVAGDALFNANRIRINTFALSARLPTVYPIREFVEAGGLMSYGVNIPDLFRRAGGYVDRILRGAKPAAQARPPGTPRVRHAAQRCGGVAARGAGAAWLLALLGGRQPRSLATRWASDSFVSKPAYRSQDFSLPMSSASGDGGDY